MTQQPVRIAIQKEGRLANPSRLYLESLGLRFPQCAKRAYVVSCTNTNVHILFVRHCDIPTYLKSGVVDFAIVGKNVLVEESLIPRLIKVLNFGSCSLMIAVPRVSLIRQIEDLNGKRIATPYPKSLAAFLLTFGVKANIVHVKGSAEITPIVGLADAICDLIQTGKTLKINGLTPMTTVYDSQAVLVSSLRESPQKDQFIRDFLAQNSNNENVSR